MREASTAECERGEAVREGKLVQPSVSEGKLVQPSVSGEKLVLPSVGEESFFSQV